MTEPDDAYSLQEILSLSQSGQLSHVRMFNDYDDSEEGAEFEFGTDQFEYRQHLMETNQKISDASKKKKKVDRPVDRSVDPPSDPPADPPAE
ncbi:hypothetical protein [Chifec microvirus UA13_27]|nr:hypothetical protein [Chifec microvirus UA13_27]